METFITILQGLAHVGSILAVIAAFGAYFLAKTQLKKLNDQIEISNSQAKSSNSQAASSNLMATFEIEFELHRRKQILVERGIKAAEYSAEFIENDLPPKQRYLAETYQKSVEEGLQSYLNAFDRLCYFIIKEYLDEKNFKIEYRDMLFDTVKNHDKYFDANTTRYRNMLKLHSRWKDS